MSKEFKSSIERITYYEAILDRAADAARGLRDAIEAFEAAQPLVRELAAYYGSAEWRRDFEDDEAGRLPPDLKRGVLSEDAVYDALSENDELLLILREAKRERGR